MPLPTRRAVRPDGKHIRDARRQRLTRPAQSRGARGFWLIVATLSLAGLIASGAAESLSVQHHAWIMPVLYTSVAGLIIALVALFI
jgi:hypothetical protein